MADPISSKHNQEHEEKEGFFGFLKFKKKFDKSYGPELRQQWEELDKHDRRIFVLGAFIGIIIFILSIVLLFILMTNLIQR